MTTAPRKPAGFTIVEIAIVLVIIGLLLGGVLKGQELIDSAKAKNLAQDLRSIPAMVHAYQDKFRALPGDDAAAVRHLCSGGDTCTVVGNGNGSINGDWDATSGTETVRFWQHLRLANLMTGSTDTDELLRKALSRFRGFKNPPPPGMAWPMRLQLTNRLTG